MNHLQQRLAERQLDISLSYLNSIAGSCDCDTAIVIKRLDEIKNDSKLGYYDRKESNGDLVILIVRNRRANTIMYRRSNQPLTAEAMRVNQVLDYTH